jgi:16S rRNA G1207 methylase RsmC
MGAHPKSIDAVGVLMLGKEAQQRGARDVQNMAFAVLLKAALQNDPRLRLVLFTNDRYGEDPEETALDLLGVVHPGTNLRLRAPARLLTKKALNWFNKAVGDDDMQPRWTGRCSGREKRASKEEVSLLTSQLLQIALDIPENILEGVGPSAQHSRRDRELASA